MVYAEFIQFVPPSLQISELSAKFMNVYLNFV